MHLEPSRSPGLARRLLMLIGLGALVADMPLDELRAMPPGDVRTSKAQFARNRVEQRRKRRRGGKLQGSKANPYGNNRARRGGFKRRYSGHVR